MLSNGPIIMSLIQTCPPIESNFWDKLDYRGEQAGTSSGQANKSRTYRKRDKLGQVADKIQPTQRDKLAGQVYKLRSESERQ